MPGAGDPSVLDDNLGILASLRELKGVKLSYDIATGRFTVQEPGWLQSVSRTLAGDSVTNEEKFRKPLRELFAAARNQYGDDAIINVALSGLNSLRNSYSDDVQKLKVLNEVIDDVSRWGKEESEAVLGLRRKYLRYLVYGFSQDMFLSNSPGVCYAFTCDWARRILLSRKASFAEGKKDTVSQLNSSLDAAQRARMMKKVDSRIRPLQEASEAMMKSKKLSHAETVMRLGQSDLRFTMYHDLLIAHRCTAPTNVGIDESGETLIQTVMAEAYSVATDTEVFIVNIVPKKIVNEKGEQEPGHAFGIEKSDGLHLFDSNVGEFHFRLGADEPRNDFLNEWWRVLYMDKKGDAYTQHYVSWWIEYIGRR